VGRGAGRLRRPGARGVGFVGFVFPGEIAVLLGGVLAFQHQLPLAAALAAAVAGAVVGDTIGYEIGRHHGHRVLDGTLGRLLRREHVDRAERYLADRGGRAVFLGRFTAALRVLIPGLAGMAGMRYRTFLAYNAAGGALWAGGLVLAGYFAGTSWHRVEHVAGRASLVLALLAVLAAAVVIAARWAARNQPRLDRLLGRLGIARLGDRYPRELAFLRRRLQPGEARGLSQSIGLAARVAAGWAFGALTQDVIAGDDAARLDRPVLDWFVDHREPWLTSSLRGVTVLGSTGFLLPFLLVVGAVLWRTRRSAVPLAYLAAGYVGAELLFRVVKQLTRRPRPPSHLAVAHYGGYAFPSGHATLATAVWGAAALTIGATSTWHRRTGLAAAAAVVALTIGVTRLYLGAHWLTDVLAGWALGAGWLAVVTLAIRSAVTPAPARSDAGADGCD
jgi:undecaprenyl-diphosphatase